MTFDPTQKSKVKKSGAGRLAVLPKMNTYQAKQEALLMIRRGRVRPTTKLYHVIGLLGTTGVLPEENVIELGGVTARTLRRYRKEAILDVVPIPRTVRELLNPKRLWTLGPIGVQLAKLQFDLVPTGYLESKIDNITHDVLCSYVYCELHKATQNTEYTAILKSRYEVTLKDFRNLAVLQPDAMITLRHGKTGRQGHFLVEYHNENYGSRAAEKITKYEQVREKGEWRDQWHIEKFPPILIVSTHKAVRTGYKEQIGTREVGCQYLIKSLSSFLEESQPLVWLDLEQNKTVNILDLV